MAFTPTTHRSFPPRTRSSSPTTPRPPPPPPPPSPTTMSPRTVILVCALVALALAGGATAAEAAVSPPSSANASLASSYFALKKIDPQKAKAFLKAQLQLKEQAVANTTETVADNVATYALLAAQRLWNATVG